MKSGVHDTYHSDSGPPTDREFKKFILDEHDLLKAVSENSIESTVREICRKDYGNSPLFHSIIADIVHNVCLALVDKLRDALKYKDLAVIFDATRIRRAEERLKESQQAAANLAYYIGENTPLPERKQS